jgi:acetylornithine deacetylase/succinyl-diaminopimelate desuccinylase-like protein
MVAMHDWESIGRDVVHSLQALIRLDTTNPPGNEMLAASYLAGVIREAGIDPVIIETAPNRGNVIARLKGDGSAKPLLMYAHTDVVPVEREKWSEDPFGGALKDGYVYGRGALDMKGIVAMQLHVFLALAREAKRNGTQLKRDVILAATADEEAGTNQGIGQLVANHPDLIRAEYAVSEFGGFSMYIGGKCFYPVQTAEKGTAWMRMVAKGRPGHASVPHDDNAVVHLARAVQKLGSTSLPMHLTPTAREFVARLADGLGGPAGLGLKAMLGFGMKGLNSMPEALVRDAGFINELRAVLHNTCSPTGLTAGLKTNVIPSEAYATLDCRTLPGFGFEEMCAELETALGDDARHVSFVPESVSAPCEFPSDTPLFKTIGRVLKQHDPAAIALPYMLTGATDAKHVARLGTICYGFSPMKFKVGERFAERVHSHDERIAVDSLTWGVRVLYDVVKDFCSVA